MNYKSIKPGMLIRMGGILGILQSQDARIFIKIPKDMWLMVVSVSESNYVNNHTVRDQLLTLCEEKLVWIDSVDVLEVHTNKTKT